MKTVRLGFGYWRAGGLPSAIAALISFSLSLWLPALPAFAEDYRARSLTFPEDRTIGDLFVVHYDQNDNSCFKGKQLFSKARGKVNVPSGMAIRLSILYEGASDLSFLSVLSPDSLQVLDVSRAEIDAHSCQYVGHLTGLQEINFCDTEFDDSCVDVLMPLRRLQCLSANRTQLRDSGLEKLSKFGSLRALSIDSNEVTDEGIKALSSLRNLYSLHLQNTRCGDAGVEALVNLPLRFLNLNSTRIDNRALTAVGKIKHLIYLQLRDTAVTDQGLPALAGLHELARIRLPDRISAAARAKFRQMLPACEIVHNPRQHTLDSL